MALVRALKARLGQVPLESWALVIAVIARQMSAYLERAAPLALAAADLPQLRQFER